MRGAYRHSVWIDVFGIVLLGLVLLGGAGYLLFEVGGLASGAGGGGGGAIAGGSPAARGATATGSQGIAGRAPRVPSGRSTPLGGESPASGAGAPGTEAPFSADWREQATPSLTSPSPDGPSGEASTGGGRAGQAFGPSGSAAAARTPSVGVGGTEGASEQRGSAPPNGWQAEVRQLSGQARALVGHLQQMDRSGGRGSQSADSPKQSSAKTSAAKGEATTSNDPGTPSEPSQVPIDDRLHWLAAVGILWGIWRIGRGA